MKKYYSLFISLIMLTTFFPTVVFAHSGGDKTGVVVDLIAGRSIDVGDVKVWNDSDFLYVKYRTDDPYCLTETHLQVASSLDDIPQANGNPIPGQFEYHESHGCVSKYTYTTPIVKNSCDIYIAAHAVVEKNEYDNRYNSISKNNDGNHRSSTETAWGSGIDFPGENWATYFIYTLEGCNVHPNPQLSLTKVADPLIYNSVGQLITYNYVIKNTGNVNLTGPFSVTDNKISVTCEQPTTGELSPGETMTCSASYSITQADLDAGSVTNTASASGGGITSPEVMETVIASVPNPSLSLTKESALDITVVEPVDQADVGDVINYTLTAMNNGNISLTNVVVSDSLLSTLSCTPPQPATLAPGESIVCTGSYTLTQADIDNGVVENTANAASDQTPTVSTSHTTPITQPNPHISLTKSTTTTSYDHVGQIINYTLVATNDGNATLTDVSISDPLIGILTCTQPITLAPAESLTCTGSYTVTQADLDAGSLVNNATVSGLDPNNQQVGAEATKTISAVSNCQPQVITADFSQIAVGGSVEGLGVVAPYLNIDAKGTAVKIMEGMDPSAYLAPNGSGISNGGISAGGGFTDIVAREALQAHQYTFTFTGVTVSDFSLHMLDYGDWNPTLSTTHNFSLTAYNANGTVVAQQVISYTTQGTISNLYGDLAVTGDAVTALPGELGNSTWDIAGSGIVKVVLSFGEGFDPAVGFDTLSFTTECLP